MHTPSGKASVIRRKITVLPAPERLIVRERLERLEAELVEGHPSVSVYATAGAGKTTAVSQALARTGRPVAWLTLDDTDAAAGRLLTYLEAALGVQVPAAQGGREAGAHGRRRRHALRPADDAGRADQPPRGGDRARIGRGARPQRCDHRCRTRVPQRRGGGCAGPRRPRRHRRRPGDRPAGLCRRRTLARGTARRRGQRNIAPSGARGLAVRR